MNIGRLEWEGGTWTFAPIDALKVRELYEDWMKAEARAEVEKLKGSPRYAEEKQELRRDINAKVYQWGGPIWSRHYDSGEGLAKILKTQLHVADPTQDQTVIDRIMGVDVTDKNATATAQAAVDHMLTWGLDPNRKRAAGTAPTAQT